MVLSALLVMMKSYLRACLLLTLATSFFLLLFVSYFLNRDNLRKATWGGGSLQERLTQASKIITDIALFNASNPKQLQALDDRLNQNKFAGMAARRIASHDVNFLYGRSVQEGLVALVPRALWPDKPVFAGSSQLIREMAGFVVNETTSFGVGQVMEFYVNYGDIGVVVGFLLFGIAYGWIDRNAASALQGAEFGQAFIWFLPGIGMAAPLASIAEIMGNVAAALVAAYVWRFAWGSMQGAAETPAKKGASNLLTVRKKLMGQSLPNPRR